MTKDLTLVEVHSKIVALENKRVSLYGLRCIQISEKAVKMGVAFTTEGRAEFKSAIRKIDSDLGQLFQQKRIILGRMEE